MSKPKTITPLSSDELAAFIKDRMEDTTLADAVEALAIKYHGKRLNKRQLEELPLLPNTTARWCFDKQWQRTEVRCCFWRAEGRTHGDRLIEERFAAAAGETECVWDAEYVRAQNAGRLVHAKERNARRVKMLGAFASGGVELGTDGRMLLHLVNDMVAQWREQCATVAGVVKGCQPVSLRPQELLALTGITLDQAPLSWALHYPDPR